MRSLVAVLCIVGIAIASCKKESTSKSAESSKNEVKIFKLGHNVNEANTWHLASLKFAEEIERLSNRTLKVEVYPNAQLGTEMDVIRSLQQGTVDMTISGGGLQNWAPLAALVETPYAFRSAEHVAKVANSEIGKKIADQIIEKAKLRPLTYFIRGPRKLTANKEIKTPDDLQKFVIRVPSSPLYVAAWQGLGAKPTPMAFSEVFTALQQGTINGQENPLAMIDSASFYEVQKFVMNTNHLISYIYLVMSEKGWETLSPDQQAILQQAAETAHGYEAKLFQESENSLENKLKEKGMTFVDVEYEKFRDEAVPAVVEKLSQEQRALYEKIINVQ